MSELAEAAAHRNWTEFTRCYNGAHDQYVDDADRFQRFYIGKQWSDADLAKLAESKRPALTINISKKVINAILGQHTKSRADIITKPRHKASPLQALLMRKQISQILDANRYLDKEQTVVSDGIIMDRGFLDCRLSFENNVLGEVEITTVDPRDVVLDPEAKEEDPDTWTQVQRIRWMSLDDIEVEFGAEVKAKLEGYVDANGMTGYGSASIRFGNEDVDSNHDSDYSGVADPEERKRIRTVRVIDRQYRRMGRVRQYVDRFTGETSDIPDDTPDDRAAKIAQMNGLQIRTVLKRRIRWTVSCDGVTAFDDWSPYDHFTIIPYFPYFTRGKPTGVMRDMVDPQEQLNKTESQNLHIINTTANSGWNVEEGSLVNMEAEDLEERGAQTGLVVTYKRGREKPEKIQPNSVPSGIENASQKAYHYITDIPGVSALVGSLPDREISGVAIDNAAKSSLMSMQPVFTSLDRTRFYLARQIISCVQKFYTEPRVVRATNYQAPEQPVEEFDINTELLNNISLGEYDIVVSSAPARDTFEETQFAEAMQLREAGVMVPDYRVIQYSNLEGKEEVAEEVKRLSGLAEPTQQEQQMAQQQFEMEVARMQAEVGELQAKSAKLQAEAQLAVAKARAEGDSITIDQFEAQTQHMREMLRIESTLRQKEADLQNKLQLAELHSSKKEGLTRYTTMMKSMDQAQSNATQLAVAQQRPQSQQGAKARKEND